MRQIKRIVSYMKITYSKFEIAGLVILTTLAIFILFNA